MSDIKPSEVYDILKQQLAGMESTARMEEVGKAKEQALREANQIMDRLVNISPQLEAGVSPDELLKEEYLSKPEPDQKASEQRILENADDETVKSAAKILEGVNDMLQHDIDTMSDDTAEEAPEREEEKSEEKVQEEKVSEEPSEEKEESEISDEKPLDEKAEENPEEKTENTRAFEPLKPSPVQMDEAGLEQGAGDQREQQRGEGTTELRSTTDSGEMGPVQPFRKCSHFPSNVL